MARSDIRTWLPLDEWAQILGFHPLFFNQLASNNFPSTSCGDVFFQQDWQNADRIGRDTIAMAIQQAEQNIAKEAGFNLLPDWTTEERLSYPRPAFPESTNVYGINPRGFMKSVELTRGHIISGGVRAKSTITIAAPYVRSDDDSDGFLETCTVTVPTTVTDENEIHLYYPGLNADDGWEIRPIKVTLSGGNAIIQFKIWQIASANAFDTFNVQTLDADNVNSYEASVDVYRVYNDPSTQVQFLWEGDPSGCGSCVACEMGSQAGCFHLRDARLGLAVPSPGSWDASTQSFTSAEFSACREPDQVKFWYYSGYRDLSLSRPNVELAPRWKYAIAYYAASLFEREVCGCSNVNQFIGKWRRDAAFSSMQEGGFSLTPDQAANRLGTTMGAFYAYREVQRMRVNK